MTIWFRFWVRTGQSLGSDPDRGPLVSDLWFKQYRKFPCPLAPNANSETMMPLWSSKSYQ